MKRILLATGGTGGHIYPALVTAEELRRRGIDVTFAGTFGSSRERVLAAGFPCIEVVSRGFVARGPVRQVAAAAQMGAAFFQCLAIVRRWRPQAVLGFGGYSSFPSVMAGCVGGVPTMVHEQNAVPGLANRWLAHGVRRVAVGFRDALRTFPATKAVWTGNPSRSMVSGLSPSEARGKLGLARDRRTVLVFGGSQGSRALNSEVVGSLAGMDLQVLHVAGKRDLEQVRSRYQAVNLSAQVREYIDPMATAYAAADLVIARAGAGTVTELGLLGIPAVLIPYPGADDHQKYNAQVLERAGAAVIIEEKSLRRDILRDKIFAQLGQGARVSDRIREKLDADFVPDAACRLADEVTGLFCP